MLFFKTSNQNNIILTLSIGSLASGIAVQLLKRAAW